MDPISVINALLAAENAHDVDAAMALFAEDAVADLAVERRTGHAEIRDWQQSLADGHFHMELRGEPEVTGNTVRFPNRLDLDMFKNLGLGTVEAVSTAVVEDGKIKHYTFALTPEYLTRLQAALASGKKLAN
ncbi:MAG TPA: nuclear transport factor 2 family protein [Armatimonadaceae bacterium]|nr:nuclear transport factor 2 family protein [Armatimonadaceae bacterium]